MNECEKSTRSMGQTIRRLRIEQNLTQETLAELLGVTSQAISKWENNATMPDIMLLPIIADTLGVTIDELFGIKHKVQEKPINCEESIPAQRICFRRFRCSICQ